MIRASLTLNLVLCCFLFACNLYADRPIQDDTNWERFEAPLLTNFNNMYHACVLEFPGSLYRYKMWFFGWATADTNPGRSGCDAIFHARSHDLKTWEIYAGNKTWDTSMNPARWEPVLLPSEVWYDAWHNGDPSVVYKDGTLFMAYSATSKVFDPPRKGHPNGMLLCVMGATSTDGIHWTKSNQPLLIEAKEEQNPNSDEGWIGDYHRPCLRWEEERWRMWFDYWLPGKGVCMGYAENAGIFDAKDGFQIQHDLKTPMLTQWPNPEIVKVGDTYHAFSDTNGYPPMKDDANAGWTSRNLCEAVSKDGLTWEVVGFIPPDPDSAACHVPQALVTQQDGQEYLYLFYATQRGGIEPNGHYNYRYDRIRMMRREIK